MPFTFSHPAIVLPLCLLPKRWFSVTGLVVGSLSPDFEYFLRMRIKSEYSHTLSGLFWFDLPVALMVTFLFHLIIKASLLHNSPRLLQKRVLVFNNFNWSYYIKSHWGAVILSILIGAFSHIFWDAFTHEHGFFVQQISVLNNSVLLFGSQTPIYKVLQHGSTLIGGFIIAMVIFKLPATSNAYNDIAKNYWLMLFFISTIIVVIRISSGLSIYAYGHLLATAIAAFFVALVITPLLVKKMN